MLSNTRHTLILLLLAVVITACNNDDDAPAPPGNPCRLVKFKLLPDNGDTITMNDYSYDADGRVRRINNYNYETEELETFRVVAYNSVSLPDTITTYIGYTLFPGSHSKEEYYTYAYNGQGLKTTASLYIDPSGQQNFIHARDYTYEYNTANRIVKSIYGGLGLYYTYEYDVRGNVTRSNRYENNVQTGSFELKNYTLYEYDNSPSLYSALYRHFWDTPEHLSPNNFTRITNYNADGTIRENQDFTFTYTYNSQGYPTSRSYATSGTGMVYPKVFFEYECQ